MDIIYDMIRRLLCWSVLGVTRLSSATEVRTEDGSNKQLETPGQVLVSVVTSTSGHSTLSATAPLDEGTNVGNGGKRKKKMMKLLKIFIILSSMGWGFAPSLKCVLF